MDDGPEFTTASVTSKDGTEIGYRQYGAGPPVVLVQGAIGTVQSYHELAQHLAGDFTVYVPERRGRPLSPRPFTSDHTVAREVEDLDAVFARSGPAALFGLSSGAVIALETARLLPDRVRKLVLYEPPLYIAPARMQFDVVARYHREVEAGNIPAAMVSALLASGLAPAVVQYAPRVVSEAALAVALRVNAWRPTPGYPLLREVVPTMRYDFSVVSNMQDRFETFAAVKCDALLLSGKRSPAYLQEACAKLDQVLPSSRRVEFDRLDHSASWNVDHGGEPKKVATAMIPFLKATAAG